MENNTEGYSKKGKFGIWKRRTSVEKYLFGIIVILFIVFLIMLGLLLCNHYKKKKPVCLTPVCKEEAGRILRVMDLSVKPCDNFYNFACGNFMKYRAMRTNSIDYYSELNGYMIYLFKEIIEKPVNESEPQFVKSLKRYYQSCMNEKPSIEEVFEFFINATHLGEWSLSTSGKFPSEELMAKMSNAYSGFLFFINAEYRNGYFKHVSVYRGFTVSSGFVKANMTDENTQKLKDRYLFLIDYIFPQLNLKEKNIENYIEEMIDLEIAIGKVMDEEREENSTEITLSELQSNCSQINFISYFKNLYINMDHPDNFSESLPLKVYCMGYINDLCQLLTANKKRALNNLIIWNSFVAALADVNRDAGIVIGKILEDPSEANGNNYWTGDVLWRRCIRRFNPVFGFAKQNILLNAESNVNEKVNTIERYVKEILKAADNTFAKSKWLDKVSRNFTRFKATTMASEIGYSEYVQDEKKINSMFDTINVTDNYLQTIFNARKIIFKDYFFNESLSQTLQSKGLVNPFMANAFFVIRYGKETILLPLGIFQPPFYAHKAPNYLNYGGIGSVIGHEIFHAFDRLDTASDEKDSSYGEVLAAVDWPEEFMVEYKKRKECLINQYSEFPLDGNATLDGNMTITENIADVEGVIVSYRAYEEFLKKHGEEPGLPGLDYNNKQMFFIRFAQIECAKEESMSGGFVHSPGLYRVLGPLMNFQGFSESFNCPSNSYMNPEKKCKLFG